MGVQNCSGSDAEVGIGAAIGSDLFIAFAQSTVSQPVDFCAYARKAFVMRDKNGRQTVSFVHSEKELAYGLARMRIDIARGLVRQKQPRVAYQSPG